MLVSPFIRARMISVVSAGVATVVGVRYFAPGLSLPWAIVIGMSMVAFVLYGFDKAAARRQAGRVPEMALHGLALLGGSPGALLGQWVFRHKTRKWPFQVVTWLIVAGQAAVLWLWTW